MKKIMKAVLALMVTIVPLITNLSVINAQEPDTFTYAISGDPFTTNPLNASDRWGLTYTNMIYSPLMRLNPDGSVKYELAESMEVAEDGLSIDVKLKEDLKWSDGEPVTADDIVFTYETKGKKENGNSDSLWIGEEPITVEKIDDYNLKFVLPSVSAAALNNLTFEHYVIPEHIYSEVTDFSESTLPVDPVGSGPYKLVEYRSGEYMQFEANEHYYGGEAGIKNIFFRIIPEASSVKVALQTGEVDASMISVVDVPELEEAGLDIHTYSEDRVGYVGFNMNSDKLQDQKVRQAIMYAMNREVFNQAIYQGNTDYFETIYSVLPTRNPYYSPDIESYDHNPEKAKELLSEAGVEDLTINVAYDASNSNAETQATLMQEQLKEVGINLELIGTEQMTIINDLLEEDPKTYDLFLNGYVFGVEPDAYKAMFSSEGSFGIFHVKNEEIDKLFEDGQKELDDEKRKEIYHELQSKIADEAFIYPYVTDKKIIASNPRIQGYEEAIFVPIYSLQDMSKLTIQE